MNSIKKYICGFFNLLESYIPFLKRNYEFDGQLTGKTVIITGSNCGLGKATAKALYKRGEKLKIIKF